MMVCDRKYLFTQILLIMTVGLGEEYRFPLSSDDPAAFKSHYWQHPESNSAIDINGIEIDVFQWQAAAESRKSVNVALVNPVWEYIGWTTEDIVLPEAIKISKVMNFRGTPTVYIKITPWRTDGNAVEVLTGGEIRIWVDPANFPVTFTHPYLLNGEKHMLQRTTTDAAEYVIICPSHFESAAQFLADVHSLEFITDVVFTEDIPLNVPGDITGADIRGYLINRIGDDIALDAFLLLLGDEIYVPPIFNPSLSYPSDDFYTTEDPDCCRPQLYTGRIPVSTAEDAYAAVNKIHKYILNPTPGIWRSKIALVADDMYRSCSFTNTDMEKGHTEYSNELYHLLNHLVPVLPFYGIGYSLSSGCTYPDLTRDLIQTINNGVALINYIGHGDPETWAGERYINKSRDLPLIHASENRLAIWVAGTCSFGNYYGKNSFMEDLLLQEDGAIAIIASTEAVGHIENYNYVNALFNEIYNYINDPNDIVKSRLGQLIWNAKNGDKKFHTFGDPALPLPFPKIAMDIMNEDLVNIYLLEEQNISFNESSQHSIVIRGNEKDITYYHKDDSITTYTVPSVPYVQMDFTGSSTCFRIPMDAGTCDGCAVIQLYQENTGWDGKIKTIQDISLLSSYENFDDNEGPVILLYQENNTVSDGSAIFPNKDITIFLEDTSGFNLIETIGHGIQYRFDDEYLTRISGNEFIYADCNSGSVIIPIPFMLEGKHEFYLEAWDGLNNKSDTLIYLDLLPPIDADKLHLSKVYPIPNPFSKNTHFTMISTHFPVDIIINIYSINGLKVNTLNKSINECVGSYSENEGCFVQIKWNGKDEYGYKIANGAYFYHVKAKTISGQIFEGIYKLAKIE